MNHFPFHVGDWMKDTAHLNATEEGVYLRLIVQYYNRERALPSDLGACVKLARAATADQRAAVKYCLDEFFEKTDDGYRSKRCEEEVASYLVRAAQAREAGKKGGRPSNVSRETIPERLHTETVTVIPDNRDGYLQEPERFPTETQTKASHKPVTNKEEKKPPNGGSPPNPERLTIFTLGLDLLLKSGNAEKSSRTFLGDLLSEFGTEKVAAAVGQACAARPIEPKGYLKGILRKTQPEKLHTLSEFR